MLLLTLETINYFESFIIIIIIIIIISSNKSINKLHVQAWRKEHDPRSSGSAMKYVGHFVICKLMYRLSVFPTREY